MFKFCALVFVVSSGAGAYPQDDIALLQVGVKEHGATTLDSTQLALKKLEKTLEARLNKNWTLGWMSPMRHPNGDPAEFLLANMKDRAEHLQKNMNNFNGFTEVEALKFGKRVKEEIIKFANQPNLLHRLTNKVGIRTKAQQHWGYWTAIGVSLAELFFLLLEVNPEHTGCKTIFMTFFVWLAGGIIELMVSEGNSFFASMNVLAQQISTVGYGSNVPQAEQDPSDFDGDTSMANDYSLYGNWAQVVLEFAHSVSSLLATLVLDTYWAQFKKFVSLLFTTKEESLLQPKEDALEMHPAWDSVKNGASWVSGKLRIWKPFVWLVFAEMAWSLVYSFDQMQAHNSTWWLGFEDAMYMTVMTMTTVGYGDLSPLTWWGEMISFLYMVSTNAVFDFAKEGVSSKFEKCKIPR